MVIFLQADIGLRLRSTENEQLTAGEISTSERHTVHSVNSEIKAIEQNESNSVDYHLELQQDEIGIIHCRDRLFSDNLLEDAAFPNLGIIRIHEKLITTISAIRNEYWISQGRGALRKLIL